MTVYADNAATTKMSEAAINCMTEMLQSCYGNPSSVHNLGRSAKQVLERERSMIASLLNCSSDCIYFTSGGTEANNLALHTALIFAQQNHKSNFVVSSFEHHSILNVLAEFKRLGYEVRYVKVDTNGLVDLEDLKAKTDKNTALVSVMSVNNEIGTIQPIKKIAEIAHNAGAYYHCDAVQAIGHIGFDIDDTVADFVSASAHKFHGPKGIGFLYSRNIPSPIIIGGGQENGARGGTENVPAIASMGTALKEAIQNMSTTTSRVGQKRDKLIGLLCNNCGAKLNGGVNGRVSSNINVSFAGVEGESLLHMLNSKGIYCSAGSACNSQSLEPSHVLKAIGCSNEEAFGSIRLTLGDDITESQILYIYSTIKECVEFLRSIAFTR